MSTSLVKSLTIVISILLCCVFHPTKPFWIYLIAVGVTAFEVWDVVTEIKLNRKKFGVPYRPMPGLKGMAAKFFLMAGALVFIGAIYSQYNDLGKRAQVLNAYEASMDEMGIDFPTDVLAFAPKMAVELVGTAVDIMDMVTECIEVTEEVRVKIEGLPEEEAKAIVDEAVQPYAAAVDEAGKYIESMRYRLICFFGIILIAEALWAISRKLYRGYAFTTVYMFKELWKERKLRRQVI